MFCVCIFGHIIYYTKRTSSEELNVSECMGHIYITFLSGFISLREFINTPVSKVFWGQRWKSFLNLNRRSNECLQVSLTTTARKGNVAKRLT